jgi:sulfopyruvate decarboxylase alpha subunit
MLGGGLTRSGGEKVAEPSWVGFGEMDTDAEERLVVADGPAEGTGVSDWPQDLYRLLKEEAVGQVSYVPDAGHARLIELFLQDPAIITNVLTTEEEGVAIAAGAWLGGQRSVLLMQSSGVGNCINMLSLAKIGRFPLLMLVTMRGEWAEFNPWQVPMGLATEPALAAIGVRTMRADTSRDLVATVASAAKLAFDADQQVAVVISQRFLGVKQW